MSRGAIAIAQALEYNTTLKEIGLLNQPSHFGETCLDAWLKMFETNYTLIADWLCGYFAAVRPSLVVSFIPTVNRVLREALQHVLPGVERGCRRVRDLEERARMRAQSAAAG